MDLRRLDHFLAVAETGSINRAAQGLGMSQAGLTKSIRALETALDARLFERGPRGATLTRQGAGFLRHARLMRNQAQAAGNAVSALGAGEEVELRLGVSMRWALRLVMPPILRRFAADPRRPRLTVLSGKQSWQMIGDLRDGELDLALATPTERDDLSGLRAVTFPLDPQRVVARREHPLAGRRGLSLAELAGWEWISGPPGTYFRSYLEGLYAAAGLRPPRPRLTLDSSTLLLDIIAETDLLGISTARMVSVEHGARIVTLDTPGRVDRTTAILTRADDALPETAESLIAEIGAGIAALARAPAR